MPKLPQIPKELRKISDDISLSKSELDKLLRKLANIQREIESRIRASTYTGKKKTSIDKSDLSVIVELYEKVKKNESFQDYVKSINEAIEKGSAIVYASTMIRKMLPPEHFISFAKSVYGVDTNDPNEAIKEVAKIIVERGEIEKIESNIKKYLVSTGVIVDITTMSPEEIRKEFENDQKYPNVESIREKLPEEYRNIIKKSIKKKSTAINKIIEELEKIRSVRKLGPSPT